MTEFWESSFKAKQEMWGWEPADSAMDALGLFKKNSLTKILIPGFGYGRNAKPFVENGFEVTGIEISETAVDLAKKYFGKGIKLHLGSVSSMPFDKESYDGTFCYSLIHLLDEKQRIKLIDDCYKQLKPNGLMIFVSISKTDFRYRQGKEINKDTFQTWPGVTLFFYDSDSITKEFGNFGLIEAKEISEPAQNVDHKPSQRFWYIKCHKK